MKIIFTILAFIAFSVAMTAQKRQVTLYANGETTQIGKFFEKLDHLEFKGAEGIQAVLYEKIDSIVGVGRKKTENYTLKYIKYRGHKGALMRVLKEGRTSVYIVNSDNMDLFDYAGVDLNATVVNGTLKKRHFFCVQNETITVMYTRSGSHRKFSEKVEGLFEGCPRLMDQIYLKNLGRRDIVDIVNYFEEKCSE